MSVYKDGYEKRKVNMTFEVKKSNAERHLISGWANVAVNADGSLPLDWQDDVITADVLEKAAIDFMRDYRLSGTNHRGSAVGIVVESMMFTKEKQQALGIPDGCVPEGWFITVEITDPELFEKVKKGNYKMFSIQGMARRVSL